MADEDYLPDATFGEQVDDEQERAGEGVAADIQLAAGKDVVVIAEEVRPWLTHRRRRPLSHVQLALYAGWTMAVLYGKITSALADRPLTLPTVNELVPVQRRDVEIARLGHLLSSLLPDRIGLPALSDIPTGDDGAETEARRSVLESLNLAILTALTAMRPEVQLAYELGRSLRDTANPPGGADDIGEQLERGRVAKIQEWLVTLSPEFPQLAGAVVAGSVGKWSDLAAVTVGTNAAGTNGAGPSEAANAETGRPALPRLPRPERRKAIAKLMSTYLLRQGDVWLMLLMGELETRGLLTPEGYVAAGEAALRRSGLIVRGIIRHYWLGLLSVAAAMAGALFLAARYLGGAGKVWTSIAAIVGGLGISAQAIASTSSRLAAEAERPVFAMAEEDAMAWAITTMPPLHNLPFRSVRYLRRANVAPTASLGRF
jgi:hypothetical protein